MARSEATKSAQARYRAKKAVRDKTKGYYLKCHKVHDSDIINQLELSKNKNGYIKELIRLNIKSKKG